MTSSTSYLPYLPRYLGLVTHPRATACNVTTRDPQQPESVGLVRESPINRAGESGVASPLLHRMRLSLMQSGTVHGLLYREIYV
jgi:hypothetical protein